MATKRKATKTKAKKKTAKKPAKKATKKAGAKKTTTKKKATKKPAAKKAKAKTKRKPNAAFMKPLTPSTILASIVGNKPLPRTEVTKKLWGYIKKNKL